MLKRSGHYCHLRAARRARSDLGLTKTAPMGTLPRPTGGKEKFSGKELLNLNGAFRSSSAALGKNVDPFMLHIYAALAEKERSMISEPRRMRLPRPSSAVSFSAIPTR
jgi:hypothetical protein